MTDVEAMGDRIKHAIKASGLTIAAASRRAGLSDQTVSGWIAGTMDPRVSSLLKFANSLGFEVAWIITGKGTQFQVKK